MTVTDSIPYVHGIFQQPWWLDAVAPGAWDTVTVACEGGEMLGRLPFVCKRRMGLTVLTQPPLTPFLGPWLKPLKGKPAAQFSQQEAIVEELIARLPRHDVFQQSFHHSVNNWLPFFWAGFEQTTRYTYILRDLSDIDRLWEGLHTDVRRRVRKAAQELTVRPDEDIDKFLHFHRAVFSRQGLPLPYSEEMVRRIHEACRVRQAGSMLVAEDSRGRTHAMNYIVWDEHSAYGLLSGADPELRSSGAITLAIWEVIKHASPVTRCFDLEGSMIRSIEHFLRGFGGELTPYSLVFRGRTRTGGLALTAHHLLERRKAANDGQPHGPRIQTLGGRLARLGGQVLGAATRRVASRG
jgi:hypothetical protein